MQDQVLLKITVITDDDTGCYSVGDLDFGVPGTYIDWLEAEPDRRKRMADHLRWLAEKCERNESPFQKL
jgi:hypothetical protein